jgi:hypothetical protein
VTAKSDGSTERERIIQTHPKNTNMLAARDCWADPTSSDDFEVTQDCG